jgi:hypothetical protein
VSDHPDQERTNRSKVRINRLFEGDLPGVRMKTWYGTDVMILIWICRRSSSPCCDELRQQCCAFVAAARKRPLSSFSAAPRNEATRIWLVKNRRRAELSLVACAQQVITQRAG